MCKTIHLQMQVYGRKSCINSFVKELEMARNIEKYNAVKKGNISKFLSKCSGGSRISRRGGVWTSQGGVDSRGGYISKILYVKTKEFEPLGGVRRARHPLDPPMKWEGISINDSSENYVNEYLASLLFINIIITTCTCISQNKRMCFQKQNKTIP